MSPRLLCEHDRPSSIPSALRGEGQVEGDFQGSAKMSYTHGLNRGGLGVYSPRIACDSDLLV